MTKGLEPTDAVAILLHKALFATQGQAVRLAGPPSDGGKALIA